MSAFLEKEAPFIFDEACFKAFDNVKEKLISPPIVVMPDWDAPFEIMCDASDYTVGVMFGQNRRSFFKIYIMQVGYDTTEQNYTTVEKEMLAVIFSLDKFRSYLLASKVVLHTSHPTIWYLF